MRLLLAAALAALLVAPLVPASSTAPSEDLAWLADRLGVDTAALPAEVQVRTGSFDGQLVRTGTASVALADIAATARRAAETQVEEEPYYGVGVQRRVGSVFFGVGAGWFGFATGPASMPCMELSVALQAEAGPSDAAVRISGAVPAGRGVLAGGFAVMEHRVLPEGRVPLVDPPVVYHFTNAGESTLVAGRWSEGCIDWAGLRLTFADFHGSGDVHTPVDRLTPS